MIKSIPLSRAAVRAAILAFGLAALAPACAASAFTASGPGAKDENVPLNTGSSTTAATHTSSGGASIVRTIVGLLIVIAVIWGLTWILRQVKTGRTARAAGTGLASIATLPLASGRSLHLVRAGSDYLLVGSAEQGVVPVHRYTEQQARDAGLLDIAGAEQDEPAAGGSSTRAIEMPGQERSAGQIILERLRQWTVRR
jgi:flagellar protein FliO/FliZ